MKITEFIVTLILEGQTVSHVPGFCAALVAAITSTVVHHTASVFLFTNASFTAMNKTALRDLVRS